jgi:hypothetical protein
MVEKGGKVERLKSCGWGPVVDGKMGQMGEMGRMGRKTTTLKKD